MNVGRSVSVRRISVNGLGRNQDLDLFVCFSYTFAVIQQTGGVTYDWILPEMGPAAPPMRGRPR
jgi:hypothetical protein